MFTAFIYPERITYQLSSRTRKGAEREMRRIMNQYPDLGGTPGEDRYVVVNNHRRQTITEFEVKGD